MMKGSRWLQRPWKGNTGVTVLLAFTSLFFQKLLAKLQSWERLEQTTGLSIR